MVEYMGDTRCVGTWVSANDPIPFIWVGERDRNDADRQVPSSTSFRPVSQLSSAFAERAGQGGVHRGEPLTHQQSARVRLGDGEQMADNVIPGTELALAVGGPLIVELSCERACHPSTRFRVFPMFPDCTDILEVLQKNV